jgi:ATP/maltotriose-dependent transcriptional regulator MalT
MRTAALQLVGKKASSSSISIPEPEQDIARFARTYFREFFNVLPRPTVIVLDSFQEARTTPELRGAFAHALEEVPDGITVIAISRSDPPHEFARLGASRRVARIEPSALACTPRRPRRCSPARISTSRRWRGSRGRATAGWRRSCCCAST